MPRLCALFAFLALAPPSASQDALGGGPAATVNSGPLLAAVGVCGQASSGAQVTNATPGGLVAFAIAPSTGSSAYAAGPCGNIVTGLGNPAFLAGTAVADPSGTATLTRPGGIPPQVCVWSLQALDLATCTTSNVLPL